MRYNTDWQSRVAPETGGNVHRPDCPHQGQAQGQVLMNTPKSTYVYFISVGSGPIKIGLSDDPHSRLATLQTAHYRKLHLLYTLECATREEAFQLETAFHRWYGDVHMMNEWFDATPSQIEADIRLLETLAKSAVQYTAHTPTSTIAKIEERAQERKSSHVVPEQQKLRDEAGHLVAYICPGCSKQLSVSGWSRHRKQCEKLSVSVDTEVSE